MELHEARGNVDFAIITVREDELQAVLDRVDRFPNDTVESQNRFYRISQVPVRDGPTALVAVARAFEQGTGEAQTVAHHIIDDLEPHWILLVGIAGGIPDFEYTLGDVILATRINDLTVQALQEGRPPQVAIAGGPSRHEVTKLITALPMLRSKFQGWSTRESMGRERPPVDLDRPGSFYGDKAWREQVRASLTHHFGPGVPVREPEVRAGPINSSDALIKDTKTLQRWRDLTRNALAVEMEAAGVFRAVRSGGREFPFLSIRGLSDIVGFKRHPAWTAYACHSAAAFALALIQSGLIKRKGNAPAPVLSVVPGAAPPMEANKEPEAPRPQEAAEPQDHSNPKRAPFHLFLAESGIQEPEASLALVGCVVMQHPEKVARALERHGEELLARPYNRLSEEEKRQFRRRGFVPREDSDASRDAMLEFLTTANFDIFAFYAPKSHLVGATEYQRDALYKALLQSRLAAKKWPAATLRGRYDRLPLLLQSVGEALRHKGWSDISEPRFLASAPVDYGLMVAEYACSLLHARLERLSQSASTPEPDPALERIRTKVRMVSNITTGESFHRKHPLP